MLGAWVFYDPQEQREQRIVRPRTPDSDSDSEPDYGAPDHVWYKYYNRWYNGLKIIKKEQGSRKKDNHVSVNFIIVFHLFNWFVFRNLIDELIALIDLKIGKQ